MPGNAPAPAPDEGCHQAAIDLDMTFDIAARDPATTMPASLGDVGTYRWFACAFWLSLGWFVMIAMRPKAGNKTEYNKINNVTYWKILILIPLYLAWKLNAQ